MEISKACTLIICSLIYIIVSTDASPVMTREKLFQKMKKTYHCNHLVKVNDLYYALDEQKNITGIPADISIHWKSGNIYFTLITDTMKMTLHILRPSGELENIKVAGLGQSTAVDNLNDIVYLATDNGIYKYDDGRGTLELYTALGEDVMYMGVNGDGESLYIATWPQNRVHVITNDGEKQEMFSNIPDGHGLTVDPRNNIYFVASKTPYILKSREDKPIKIKGLPRDKASGIFVSRSDIVYAMDEDSNLYVIDSENAKATKLGSFSIQSSVNSFAMDTNDNILIGVKDAIMKFNVYEASPCPE